METVAVWLLSVDAGKRVKWLKEEKKAREKCQRELKQGTKRRKERGWNVCICGRFPNLFFFRFWIKEVLQCHFLAVWEKESSRIGTTLGMIAYLLHKSCLGTWAAWLISYPYKACVVSNPCQRGCIGMVILSLIHLFGVKMWLLLTGKAF